MCVRVHTSHTQACTHMWHAPHTHLLTHVHTYNMHTIIYTLIYTPYYTHSENSITISTALTPSTPFIYKSHHHYKLCPLYDTTTTQ